MISRKLYIIIIVYVLMIVALSVLLGFLILKTGALRYTLLCGVAIIILSINLITYLNRTNRNIRLFFEAVRNDDSNINFPANDKSAGLKELNESMNRVNKQIQRFKFLNMQQEQYFQKILGHLATGILTYDKKGFIHHANSAAKSLLKLETFTHLQQLDRIDARLFPVIKNLKPFERRLVGLNTNDGEIQVSLKSTSFGSDDDELMILSIQDIKYELDEKEVESWMKLIRVLMHEIMNSITPITSLSESIYSIYKKGEKTVSPNELDEHNIATTVQGLKVISEQGKGLMNFVESYRKLTRIPKPELKTIKITDIFSRVKILSESFDNLNNTKIIFDVANNDLEIVADENLISLVLINLIKNAVEANQHSESGLIKISAKLGYDHQAEISVTDNGPGISKENIDKIFIPFFTTRPDGSGIGLSLSRQIMGAHGGNLRVRSVPGKETVFYMTFRG
ncbi:MAG TPA: ATP-binding protein [Bacteroidales bacterium]|nr:ATP-binding protein [Bacteroidales bacterium]